MRETLHAKERLEFTNRGAITEQEPNLSSCLELKQEHHDAGKGKTRKGINNLKGIAGIGDVGEQRGKTTKETVEGANQSTN